MIGFWVSHARIDDLADGMWMKTEKEWKKKTKNERGFLMTGYRIHIILFNGSADETIDIIFEFFFFFV